MSKEQVFRHGAFEIRYTVHPDAGSADAHFMDRNGREHQVRLDGVQPGGGAYYPGEKIEALTELSFYIWPATIKMDGDTKRTQELCRRPGCSGVIDGRLDMRIACPKCGRMHIVQNAGPSTGFGTNPMGTVPFGND